MRTPERASPNPHSLDGCPGRGEKLRGNLRDKWSQCVQNLVSGFASQKTNDFFLVSLVVNTKEMPNTARSILCVEKPQDLVVVLPVQSSLETFFLPFKLFFRNNAGYGLFEPTRNRITINITKV